MSAVRALGLSAATAAMSVVAGCRGQQSVMDPAGPQASRIEWLFWVVFWIALSAFVLVMLAFGRAAMRSGASKDEPPLPIIKEPPGDRAATVVVGLAVALTVIGLFSILALSAVTGAAAAGPTSKNPVTIQITGHQWWWEVTYPNTQPDQIVITANEIHIPVGKPIVILTKSEDVIHSFWPPNVNGKRDLLPGNQTAYWMQVDKPGIYRGQCAEFCGYQHAHMGFRIVAESEADFSKWQQAQIKPAKDPSDAETIRGRAVFMSRACVMCHTIRGTDAGSRVGPDLTHVGSRQMIAAETLPNTRGALAGWILDPQGIKPGNRMSPNPMPPDDLNALITYLQSLQ